MRLFPGEKGTVDPGMFSVDDPPEEYNDFIQWVKAVRAKLRVSQTALSDALNNTPQLTKRYSQTIVSRWAASTTWGLSCQQGSDSSVSK